MNKKILYIIPLILVLLFLMNSNKRAKYEDFLLNEYKKIPNYTKDDLKNIPKPEHPDLGSYQNYFMTLDPNLGYIPYNRLKESLRYTMSFPENRSIQWTNTPSNMGGRTRCFAFDPSDITQRKAWAGGVTGGLWYNNDVINTNSPWVSVDDMWDNLIVSSIAFDPNDSNTIYVGTGEANTAVVTYRESSGRGIGLWKSNDGGNTWQLLESTENFAYITDIVIDDNSVIYIGVVSGIYYGEQESLPSDGLYKSTNAGISWEQVLPLIPNDTTPFAPSDIEISENGRIFVGTMKNTNGNGGSYILYSDTGNNQEWNIYDDMNTLIRNQEEFNIPGRVVLSSSKSNPDIVYAVFGSGYINSYNFNYSYGNHIIKTSNGGNSWSLRNIPNITDNNWATLAWHALEIEVDPLDENTVYVGGLDIYKSSDSCNTWSRLSDWSLMYEGGGEKYVHADIHSIIFRNDSSEEFFVTSDGGIFYTNNATTSDIIFYEVNNNYNTLQYYTGSIYPELNTEIFVGGLQDNGTLIYNNQPYFSNPQGPLTTNNMISGGDGAYCFWDKNEPEILITSTYYNRYYLFIDNEYVNYFNGSNGIFINPSDYDYNNNTLFCNAVRFNGSLQNRIYTISNINGNPDEQTFNIGTNTNVPFSHVKYSPNSSNYSSIYLGTQSGYLYKVNFSDIDTFSTVDLTSNDFPTANISSISEGLSSDTLLVTFSNYGISSVWYTVDGGDTWDEKQSNLPDMPIRSCILHPENSNYAILGTEIGVWGTSNLNSNTTVWEPYNNGIANVRIDMLTIRDNDNLVLASTHGRGQFYGYFNIDDNSISGDLNNDSNIDVLDVVLLVNIALDNNYSNNADINNDNFVNVLDIVLLVNLILGD